MLACTSRIRFEMDPILESNPEELAIQHFNNGDKIEWIGCFGYARFIPGIPVGYTQNINDENVYWIKGTGDDLTGTGHSNYIGRAVAFAKIYNQTKLKLIKQ